MAQVVPAHNVPYLHYVLLSGGNEFTLKRYNGN